MNNNLDPITRKKLVIAKHVYQNALAQTNSGYSLISGILAVIGFDFAVETTLKAIVGSLDSSKHPSTSFQGIIDQANDLLEKKGFSRIPDEANIRYIHDVRNDAQHKASYPNESEVSDCRTYVRDFLKKVCSEIWGLEFANLHLADMIQHEEIRNFLNEAEEALDVGDIDGAITKSAVGLEIAISKAEKGLVGDLSSIAFYAIGNALPRGHQGKLYVSSLHKSIKKMRETLLFVSLGVDISNYIKYKSIVGEVNLKTGGEYSISSRKENIDDQEVEFVISYSINTILEIERRVGDLEKPLEFNR